MDVWEIVIVALVGTSMCNGFSIATTEPLEIAAKDLDGEALLDMGSRTNKTLLQILGMAIENLEENVEQRLCESIPCWPWSEWSACSASMIDTFGSQMRMRNCSYGTSGTCVNNTGAMAIENESKFCKGSILPCPEWYITSENDFCLKLVEVKMSPGDAKENCQQHGGHLMNIDTEERWVDFGTLTSPSSTSSVWIDGTREVKGGSWTYASGKDPENHGVNHWKRNEPTNGGTELCKVVDNDQQWYDRDCSNSYVFMCEFRRQ